MSNWMPQDTSDEEDLRLCNMADDWIDLQADVEFERRLRAIEILQEMENGRTSSICEEEQ